MQNKLPQQSRRPVYFNETFQSSMMEERNQKFLVEKTLINGIKQNDVSKIIATGEQGGNSADVKQYDQKAEASINVIEVRTKYNQIKTQVMKTQAHIQKMTGHINFMKQEQAKYQDIYQTQKNNFQMVQKKLADVTTDMDNILYRRDTYLFLQQAHKKDNIILKKRYLDAQLAIHKDRTKLNSIKKQTFNNKKLGLSCQKMLKEVQETVMFKHRERQSKINSFYQVLNKKQDNIRRISERQKQVEDVMLEAMTEKSIEEKQWIKIFNINNFLKKMLKAKMERIMNKYAIAEKAFQKIRLETGVNHSEDFIARFINRQKNYGRLLQSISEKQAQLNELKAESKLLEAQQHNLIYQSDSLSELHVSSNIIPTSSQKIIQKLNIRLLAIQKNKQLMYHNSIKALANLFGLQRRDSLLKKYQKSQCTLAFRDYLIQVKEFLQGLSAQKEAAAKIESAYLKSGMKQKTMTEDMLQKNLRVKTLQTNDEDGVYEDLQEKDMDYDNISEIDFLNHYRRAIKKNDLQNRKFRIKTKPY